ncbi:hypothetical protein FACS1894216_21800 [Synergistales bacterium]|nr:hypothetical protein FACS1894216_21800 [Synergistales bacterium]
MAVPTYVSNEKVNPMPGVRIAPQRFHADADAFGAGAARAGQGFAAAVKVKIDEFDDAKALSLFNKFQSEVDDYHLNPENGVYNTKKLGGALGMARQANADMNALTQKYAEGAGAGVQRRFLDMAGRLAGQYDRNNAKWQSAQITAFRDAEADAAVGMGYERIAALYAEDDMVAAQREFILNALGAKLKGLGPEATEAAVRDVDNKIAMIRLNQITQKEPLRAEDWLTAHKEDFSAETYLKAREYVERHAAPYKAEALRDEIVGRFGGDEAAAREYVKENFTGDEERRVMAAVEGEYSDRRRIERQREADAYEAMQNAVASGKSYGAALSAIQKSGLQPRLKDALINYAKSKFNVGSGGGRRGSDPREYNSAMAEAMEFNQSSEGKTVGERNAAVAELNAKYAGKVMPGELKRMTNIFYSAPRNLGGTAGSSKTDRKKQMAFNPITQVKAMMKDAGITDPDKQDAFTDQFLDRWHKKEIELGRQLDNGEIRRLAVDEIEPIVKQDKSGWFFNRDVNVQRWEADRMEAQGFEWDEESGKWAQYDDEGRLMLVMDPTVLKPKAKSKKK